MLDSETRFWLSQMISEHKGNDDVSPMFRDAKQKAGKIPEVLISDGAANFHHAWKDSTNQRISYTKIQNITDIYTCQVT